MLNGQVLVGEPLPVKGEPTGAVTVLEVSALQHKAGDHAMEDGVPVLAGSSALGVLNAS